MKKIAYLFILFVAFTATIVFTKPGTSVDAASGGVALDAEHFPDAKFRDYLMKNVDKNKNNYLENDEISSFNILNLNNATYVYSNNTYTETGSTEKYMSIEGVEYLTGLTNVSVYGLTSTDLDFSKCVKLKAICLHDCLNLESIKTPSSLEILSIGSAEELKDVDVTLSSSLRELCFCRTQVKKLDLSACSNLKILMLQYMPLKKINISNLYDLYEFDIFETNISKIDLPDGSRLDKLYKLRQEKYNGWCMYTSARIDGVAVTLRWDNIGIIFE